MRRAFIFSVDALVGLGIALAVIGIVMSFSGSSGPAYHYPLNMQRYTADLLSVMQKGGYVATALGGDATSMRGTLALTGSEKCFLFKAIDTATMNITLSVPKAGCGGVGTALSSAVSNEYYGGKHYIVELSGWVQ
jgi:hypothetical protein